MGLINGALQIGRSALLAYQSALQVLGQNITNAGSDSYVRQTPLLTPYQGMLEPGGIMPGGGVALTGIQRKVDASVENRLRVSLGNHNSASTQKSILGRVEAVLNELGDADLSSLLQQLFNAFSNLQNQPQDQTARGLAITSGQTVISEIQRQRSETLAMRDELNEQVVSDTRQADQLASQIALLNRQITAMESPSTGSAAALRDQRDSLLRDLSQIVQIEVREQPNKGVNVYLGNDLLVSGGISRGLTTTLETSDQRPRTIVRFADNKREVSLQGGELAGLVAARDEHVMGHVESLNGLADALIQEVNKVHASGQGLKGYSQVVGAFDLLRTDVALNSTQAGLKLKPRNGSFIVTVTNTQTTPATRTATMIAVDLDGVGADDSLETLVAKIGGIEHLSAQVTSDKRLQITAESGFEVTFGEDSSNALAALGINVFFTGSNADDLAISSYLTGDPSLLAAATQPAPGDGSNAGRLAAISTQSLVGLDGQSMTSFYNKLASNVAVRSNAAAAMATATETIVSALTSQKQSISGVSLDEETVSMLRFEQSFGAAARYTTVVNQLMQEMLAIVQ